MYGWTYAYIASMTTAQQFAALDLEETKIDKQGREIITFQNEREYAAWASSKGK